MREIVLANERYCAVEISKNGIINGFNNTAFFILRDLCIINTADELNGFSVTGFSSSGNAYDISNPEKNISSIKGLKHIDNIFYKDTESVIVRFAVNNEVFAPLFDAVKFSSSLYLELDNNLNIIFANNSFIKASGSDISVIYGAHLSNMIDKKGAGKINSAADLCRNDIIESIKVDEIQFNFKGIDRIFDVEVSPVNDGKNSVSGIICHLADNSAEKKFKKMNRTIRRMSAIANFAGGIAHDYNNALTAVLGNISLAKMDAEKNSELEDLLRDAESAGLKIKMLTERLGMFARGMKPSKDKADITQLIEGILPEVFLNYKGRYKINFQKEMKHPEIDQELISEAVRHVIENAVDAADKPDGEIVVEAEEAEVDKESVFREISLVSGRYIIISVSDNGPGLDPLSSGDIFDPYVTTKAGREGLGLALAYTILKRHRGFISVDSGENGGAVFKIYIPLF